MMVSLSNAKRVINMDMVKPMPPKKPTPNIDFQFSSFGSLHSPAFTAKKANKNIVRHPWELARELILIKNIQKTIGNKNKKYLNQFVWFDPVLIFLINFSCLVLIFFGI